MKIQSIFFFTLLAIDCLHGIVDAFSVAQQHDDADATESSSKKKIVIVGGGPAGLLFAHYLVRRPNYEVHVVEKRPDPQQIPPSELRTYPISLQQQRGIRAIKEIGGSALLQAVEQAGGWMKGTHFRSGDQTASTKRFQSPMLSLDRNQLALVLLQHLLKFTPADNTSICMHFCSSLEGIDLDEKTVTISKVGFSRAEKIPFDTLVGADGSRSAVRQTLNDKGLISSTTTQIPIDTKSLNVACKNGSFELQKNHFNGWTLEHGTNALALPLKDDISSGAMFFPLNQDPFQNMTDPEEVLDFFRKSAPETLAQLITREEAKALPTRPISRIYSVKCNQLHVEDKVLLLGDAAHATNNALGQGANSALQDVQIFFGVLDRCGNNDWASALENFTKERLPCLKAVQEMSEYLTPPTPRMLQEFRWRQNVRTKLPSWLGPLLVGHDSMQLLADTDLSYTKILQKTRWWSDRVKKATMNMKKTGP